MRLILTIAVALFTVLAIQAQDCNWELVRDVESGYRISFPGSAEKASQEVPTAKGNVIMETYSYQSDIGVNDPIMVYMTATSKYPDSFFPDGVKEESDMQAMLDGSVSGAVNNTKGTLRSSENIYFNGYPGRIAKINIQGGYILEMKTVLVDLRLYLVQVIYAEKDEDTENAKRFFSSFDILNVKK